MIQEHDQDGWRRTEVADALLLNQPDHRRRLESAQTHLSPTHRDDCPGKAPTVTMEHRQRPEVDAIAGEANLQGFAQSIEIGATMAVHNAFGTARRATC